jgi:hypothetical protein
MGQAKIVNVTPLPGGAGELHFDDGRPPLPVTPEIAEEHRAKLAASAAPVRNDIYGNPQHAPQPPSGFEKAVGEAWHNATTPAGTGVPGYNRGNPSRIDRSDPSIDPVTGQPLPPHVGIAAPGEIKPSPAPSPAPAAPQPAPGPQDTPPASIARDPEQPPAEPVDPLVAMAQQVLARKMAGGAGGGPARMTPSSEKTEISRGTPYDLAQARDRIAADAAVKDAQFAKMRAEKAGYDAQAAAAAAQLPRLQLEQARAQHDVDQREKNYKIERAGLETELDNYDKTAQVDPRRFFSGANAVSGMMATVGSALGAYGAALAHTQNWAFESMQKMIQQDIDAQVHAINTGHATRATALKRFVDYYDGDMNKAQTALGIAMNKAVTTEASRFAAQSKSRDIANNAASFSALFDQASQKREQDLYNAALGTSKTEQTSKMQGGAGSGGKVSLDDLLKYKKLLGSNTKDQGALGLTSTGVARHKSNYANKKAELTRFGESLQDESHAIGVRRDPTTGAILNKEGKPATEDDLDIPFGVGGIEDEIPDALLSDRAKEYRVDRTNSGRLHANVVYNKSIDEKEGEEEAHKRLGRNKKQILDSLRQRSHELWALHRDTDAGYAAIDPRIVNQYNEAQKAVNESRATGQPLPGPRPMIGQPSGTGAEEAAADERE